MSRPINLSNSINNIEEWIKPVKPSPQTYQQSIKYYYEVIKAVTIEILERTT
jgi:hypothetical protein